MSSMTSGGSIYVYRYIFVVPFSFSTRVLPSSMSSMIYCIAGKNGNRADELTEYNWPAK